MTKYTYIAVGVTLIGMVLVVVITLITLKSRGTEKNDFQFVTVDFNAISVRAEVVETYFEMNKGLSGRESLAEGDGMLFIFEETDTHSFWMPDMHFAIDIIWLDESMKVVYVKENATPESYPEKFSPPSPAKYVLEVPAGFSHTWGIVEGTQAIIR